MKSKLLVLGALFATLCASVQGQLVPKTPLVHLSFDNVNGTTVLNDGAGGAAMNGTLNSTVGTATIVPGGKFGNALQVTGTAASDASVRIANAVVPLTVASGSAWSVACWIKTTTQGGTWMYQGSGGWGVDNTTFAMVVNNGTTGVNGTAAGGVRNSRGWQQGTTPVNDGNWHHIVFTFDGTTKVQYVDGVVDTWVANQWANTPAATGTQFWIGGGGTGENDGQVCLNGLIDEAYVFNLALSASDVQSLFISNSIPTVPVAVTVSPTNGFIGQVVTVTATATPASGTATNAVANLSALGLANSFKLVQSSPNVFTNTFTITANAPFGADLVTVTMIDTEPLAGSGAAVFTVVPRPPTNAIVVTQIKPNPATNSVYTEASFTFLATNDAPSVGSFPMTYAWYTNNVLVSTNPMGPSYTFLTVPTDNNKQIYAIARVANTNFSSIAVTSSVVTLVINPGTPQFPGLKQEVFPGVTSRANVEIGNVGHGVISAVTNGESGSTGGIFGNNTSRRYSGYFIASTNDNYVFFLASDDDADLFLSTDSNPANKQLIAQETVWSNPDQWQTSGGNSSLSQKRSDQWSPDPLNFPAATPSGVPLVAGQKYYIEIVEHNGTGGDGVSVTYETLNELINDGSQPVDGSPSRLTTASNNIVLNSWPGTTITWVKNLTPAGLTVIEGGSVSLTVLASSDAEMIPSYQWYINGAPFPGATGTNFNLSSIPLAYSNATITAVAHIPVGSLAITSSVTTLTVNQAVHEPGFIFDERFDGKVVNDIITGNITNANYQMTVLEWGINVDNVTRNFNNFARRVTGYFKPPTTGNYTFYVTSDDDSILFLSTDDTPGNKRQVASQGGWNAGGNWRWNTVGGGGGVVAQTDSDTFTIGGVLQNPSGIHLVAGQRYYMEQDMHQGGGGACLGVTYTLTGAAAPASGTETALKGSVIEMNVPRCSFVAFTQQPQNVTNAPIGSLCAFFANGVTDSQLTVGGLLSYENDVVSNKLFFQWFTNGVAVPGANSSKFLYGPVTAASAGVTVSCQMRPLGYTDDALNPIWTNSTIATITSVGAAIPPELIGHFVSGTADLNDSANVVSPGLYYGIPIRATTASQFYYFTNDVPPGAPAGAQSLRLNGQAIAITNTCASDPGYVIDLFDGGIATNFTVMAWVKGNAGAWQAFVTKGGDNGIGWALRTGGSGNTACWTLRGTTQNDDMQAGGAIPAASWHHFAGTYDSVSGNRILYVDGVQVASETGNTAYTPAVGHMTLGTEDLNPGNTYGNNGYLTGNLYDVRIYNYPLTQSQVISVSGARPQLNTRVATNSVGNQALIISYLTGSTLLQATNVLGPWTAIPGPSPVTNTIDPTQPQMYFRVSNP